MVTRPLSRPEKSMRKFVRAYVRLGLLDDQAPELSQLQRYELAARELSHWYDDELDLAWECDCDACDFWREQLTIHRRARARK